MIVRQFLHPALALALAAGFSLGSAQAQDASVASRIGAALADNDAAGLSQLLAEDFVDQSEDFLGDGGLLRQLNELHAALPGAVVELNITQAKAGVIAISRTIRGVAASDLLGYPPPPIPVTVEAMDFFTVEDNRITSRRGLIDKVGLLRQLTMPFPAKAPLADAAVEEVMRFEPGAFPEGLINNGEDSLLLTMLFDNKILSVAPDGRIETYASLPFASDPATQQGTMCIARDKDGAIYITVQSKTAAHHGLWRLGPDGAARVVAAMPPDAIPNGVDIDDMGRVYIADSSGAVWQWRPGASQAAVWADGDLVRRRPYIGNLPGPNGLKVKDDFVHVTVSDTSAYVRIPIRRNGDAGDAELIAYGAPGDDFAIDDDGAAYITTHPFNSVLKVTKRGVEEVVADAGDGIIGPTSAALAETPEGTVLYVVTDGGLYAPIPGVDIIPKLVRIKID
ncbi:ester cyclase [Hyphococcus sp.]|jgi:predicted ester cyclase|uniref:ester cyclase n=1 Tax=Hyphococcus sp. TaxID=2038636 RepID=UPI003D0DC97A